MNPIFAAALAIQDWIDVESIALRQRNKLDEDLIWQELAPLLELKEDAFTAPRLRSLLDRARA